MTTYTAPDRSSKKDVALEQMERIATIEHPPTDPETQDTILQTIKKNPRAILYAVLMGIGPMLYGFDQSMVGLVPALPSFQIAFGTPVGAGAGVLTYYFPAYWLSLWNAMVQVGVMAGAASSGPISDRFGRKITTGLGGLIACIATAVVYVADLSDNLNTRRSIFLVGKIILGLSIGIILSTCQTYNSEIAPTRIRGPLLSIFAFFVGIGQLVAVSIVFSRTSILGASGYRVCLATQWALAGATVLMAFIIPETPTYFLRKQQVANAEKAYTRLYGLATLQSGILALQRTLEEEDSMNQTSAESKYVECFRGANWRRTRIILWANLIQQFLGVTLVANSSYFLQLGGMSASNSIMITQITIALVLPSNIISWFSMTIFGRRTTLLASTSVVGLLWAGIGVAGCFPNSAPALWFIGIGIMVVMFAFCCGVGSVYPVVAAETSSARLRAKSNALGFVMNGFGSWLFNFVVPYLFNVDEANLGGKTGFVFTGLCVVGFAVIFFEVPEMKGRSYAELDEMFELRMPTRAFKNYDVEPHSDKVVKSVE